MCENIGLYRGKWRDNGEWAFGALVIAKDILDDARRTYILDDAEYLGYGEFTGVCDVDPKSIGEFTGIHDETDTLIFEGDILKIKYLCQKPVKAVVEFTDGKFTARYTRNGKEHVDNLSSTASSLYEVIGNIYDNPELLGGNSP